MISWLVKGLKGGYMMTFIAVIVAAVVIDWGFDLIAMGLGG